MADLERALEARHPDRFRKHSMMIAVASVIVEDGKLLLVRDTHGFWPASAAGLTRASAPTRPSSASCARS